MASEDQKAPPVDQKGSIVGFPVGTRPNIRRRVSAIIGGMGVVVIIETDPHALRAAGLNPARPYRELGLRVIVPVPTLGAIQADVNLIGGLDELIG